MISQRTQTLLLLGFLALVGAAIAVMFYLDKPEPPPKAPSAQSEFDSGSQQPSGLLQYQAGPEDTILRMWTGSCQGGGSPTLELSADDGYFFRSIRIPQVDSGGGISAASPAISAIVAMETKARREFVMWGADRDCRIRSYETDDSGGSWSQGDLPITQWYVHPKTGVVFSPGGEANITCDGISTLNGFDEERAVATCHDKSLHISEDGRTWESAPDLNEATTAVVFTSTTQGFSLRNESDCHSRLYSTDDGGESWTEGGCAVKVQAFPAMGVTSKVLVVGGNGPVWISTNDGDTWKRPINPNVDPEVLGRKLTPSPGESTDRVGDDSTDDATDEPTDEPSDEPAGEPEDEDAE